MNLKLITPPTELPLTLQEVKDHLRVDGNSEDAYLTGLLKAAVAKVQNITNRQLLQATFRLTLDRLTPSIPLPRPPFATITKLQATDDAGQVVDFDNTFYTLDDTEYTTVRGIQESGWYASTYGKTVIEYKAGYATAADIPEPILLAIKLLLTYFYENRGDSNKPMPEAVDALLGDYRIWNF